MKKRILALTLALLMVLTLAACAGGNEPAATGTPETQAPAANTETPASDTTEMPTASAPQAESIFPLVTDGSVTLTIWQTLDDSVLNYMQEGDNYFWNAVQKLTGLQLDFTYVSGATTEPYQVMISSGDYTDIIIGGMNTYPGGEDAAIDDGVFLDLSEYEAYMPNYIEWVNKDDYSRRTAYTDSGRIAYLRQIYDKTEPQFLGYGIRQDWLEDLGLETPVTINDWTDVLNAFKTEKTTNGAAPLELESAGIPKSGFFVGAYGCRANIFADFYIQIDDVVTFSPATEGFRGYLETMAGWYVDGLLDPEFVSMGGFGFEPQAERVANNMTGAAPMQYTSSGTYYADIGTAEEGAYFELAPIPKVNADDELLITFTNSTNVSATGGTAVTTACEYPEYAIAMLDYFYSDEGSLLANYGIEGETFTYVDGKPVQTELLTNNPDLNANEAQQRYLLHNGPLVISLARLQAPYEGTEGIRYNELWAGVGKYNIIGNISYTSEEGTERSAILNDINTYVSEFTLRAITGEVDLDDAVWAEYLATLESMNLTRATEITQAGYDRMINR